MKGRALVLKPVSKDRDYHDCSISPKRASTGARAGIILGPECFVIHLSVAISERVELLAGLSFARLAARREAIPIAINAIPEKNRIVFRPPRLARTLGGQPVGGHVVMLTPSKPERSGITPVMTSAHPRAAAVLLSKGVEAVSSLASDVFKREEGMLQQPRLTQWLQ